MASFSTRPARVEDLEPIIELLPRLADYELPRNRTSEMFWASDAELLRRWATQNVDADGIGGEVSVRVGVDEADSVAAAAIVSMNKDHFSGESNAHLEVIVVAPEADGHRLGRTLIGEMQAQAKAAGAITMSLHVVGNNERARNVYKQLGFDEEMIRAISFL